MEEEEGLGWVRFVLFVPSVWVGGAIGVISLRFALYNLKKKGVVLVLGVVVGDVSKRQREGTKRPLVKWCGLWGINTTTRRGEGLL